MLSYETACCLGVELTNDLPQTAYHDFYAKEGHVLHFEHTDPIPNRNTAESLHACVQVSPTFPRVPVHPLTLLLRTYLRILEPYKALQAYRSDDAPLALFHHLKPLLNHPQMHYIPPPVTFNDEQVCQCHMHVILCLYMTGVSACLYPPRATVHGAQESSSDDEQQQHLGGARRGGISQMGGLRAHSGECSF